MQAVLFAAFLVLVAVGCTRQGQAYRQSPICRQAENACKHYEKTREQAGSDRGAGLELLREDCEASQRACAESVYRMDERSYPEGPERRWRDFVR